MESVLILFAALTHYCYGERSNPVLRADPLLLWRVFSPGSPGWPITAMQWRVFSPGSPGWPITATESVLTLFSGLTHYCYGERSHLVLWDAEAGWGARYSRRGWWRRRGWGDKACVSTCCRSSPRTRSGLRPQRAFRCTPSLPVKIGHSHVIKVRPWNKNTVIKLKVCRWNSNTIAKDCPWNKNTVMDICR